MKSLDFRICAVRIYEHLGSMRQAAKALRVSVSSISRWTKRTERRKYPCRGSKFAAAAEAAVKVILDRYPCTTARQLKSHVLESFGIDVSRQLMHLVLSSKLGYSWKRTRKRGPRNHSWSDQRMEAFKASFSAAFQSGNLSSWDESSFDMSRRPGTSSPSSFGGLLSPPGRSCCSTTTRSTDRPWSGRRRTGRTRGQATSGNRTSEPPR